ncbi:hypothetical protein [Kitasatospora sp. NPDC005751]|uniref:hypothetical protein n=1 Tax=Kitasatospora sp. NPDC005751 TaxID=3157064 RepID=UPI0033F66B2C
MTEQQSVPSGGAWPAVRPEVVAEVVAGLSARLQKRLDGAAAKLAERPVRRDGDEWRIEVDEETSLVLHAPGGVVRGQADVRCGCLLAPACVHRAAAVTVCRIADADNEPGPDTEPEPASESGPEPGSGSGSEPGSGSGTEPDPVGGTPGGPRTAPDAAPDDASGGSLTAAEQAAVHHLHRAAAAVLAAGVGGAGAVLQAELLRAAHRARLNGFHRPAAAAVAVVSRLRAARSGEPDHRLALLVAGLRELLDLTTALTTTLAPALTTTLSPTLPPTVATALTRARTAAPGTGHRDLAALRGTARQVYGEAGGLRLYGLFAEPVLTATHAGVLTWAVDATGVLSTVAEVMPHADPTTAAPQAVGAGNRAVRLGDALLSHREFSRAGLAVQGATRSANGRLGAGSSVRAVRAGGVAWTADPVAGLWTEPPAVQVERALAAAALPYEGRPAGSDLLFLDVTLLGAAPHGSGGVPELLADCGGLVVALRAAHDHPGLAFRGNLALLATAPGLRLRVIGRLERAEHPELRLLAVGTPPAGPEPGEPALALPADRAARVNLGLERLQTADLTLGAASSTSAPVEVQSSAAGPVGPAAPVHLLVRRVEQAVTGGRQGLALGAGAADTGRSALRAAGLATGAALLDALRAAAADQPRDVFGRVVADDHAAFTSAWLAAACYSEELASALCAGGWQGQDPVKAGS